MSEIKKWGNLTWDLIHCIIVLCPSDKFSELRESIINCIHDICTILPCPLCKDHASQYLRKVKWKNIQTKDAVHAELVTFHNNVNRRLSKKELSPSEAYSLYDRKNMREVGNAYGKYYCDMPMKGTPYALMTGTVKNEKLKLIRMFLNRNIGIYEKRE